MPFYKKYKKYKKMIRRGKYTPYQMKKRAFAARVKKVLMKTAETKYLIRGGDNQQLYHDRGTATATAISGDQGAIVFDPWALIPRGTGPRERVGDEIYPRGMSMRITCYNETDRPNLFYRIIVCRLNRVINGVAMTGGNFDLFDASGSNDCIASITKDDSGIKILYDKTFQTQGHLWQYEGGQGTVRRPRLFKKLWINRKGTRKVIFSAANTIVNNPIAVFVLPYDEYATLRTDAVADTQWSYKLYFKDV
jgi:hypothetical protein